MRGWVQRWATTVERQYHRAREHQHYGDLDLFALALRNLLRAVEEANKETGSAVLAKGLAEFNRKIPNAKDVRDILEHFDDYERGLGFLTGRVRPEFVAKTSLIATNPDGTQVRHLPNMILALGEYQLAITPAYEAAMALAEKALEELGPKKVNRP